MSCLEFESTRIPKKSRKLIGSCRRSIILTSQVTRSTFFHFVSSAFNRLLLEISKLVKIARFALDFQGHEYTLKLNEAYRVLMKKNLRKDYDVSVGRVTQRFGRNVSGLGCSSWKGALRPEALFVDENACIGDVIRIACYSLKFSIDLLYCVVT